MDREQTTSPSLIELNEQLAQHPRDEIRPLFTTWDVASSLLQKSLRRGLHAHALSAAKYLIDNDTEHFWRRFSCIAFEDFGHANIALTENIVAAARNKMWRAQVGNLHTAAHFIHRLAPQPKDRRADDLYMLGVAAREHPSYRAIHAIAPSHISDLLEEAVTLIGKCERRVPYRSVRAVLAGPTDEAIQKAAPLSPHLVNLCVEGRKACGYLLPLMLAQTAARGEPADASVITQSLDNEADQGVLLAALDGYTQLGRQAISHLLAANKSLAAIVRRAEGVSPTKSAAMLLFAVEGGLLNCWLEDPVGRALHDLARGCWSGLPRNLLPDAAEAMRQALPELNHIRRQLVKEQISTPRQENT